MNKSKYIPSNHKWSSKLSNWVDSPNIHPSMHWCRFVVGWCTRETQKFMWESSYHISCALNVKGLYNYNSRPICKLRSHCILQIMLRRGTYFAGTRRILIIWSVGGVIKSPSLSEKCPSAFNRHPIPPSLSIPLGILSSIFLSVDWAE